MKTETNQHGVTIQYNDDGSMEVVRDNETRKRQYQATADFAVRAAATYASVGDKENERAARDHAKRLTTKANTISG